MIHSTPGTLEIRARVHLPGARTLFVLSSSALSKTIPSRSSFSCPLPSHLRREFFNSPLVFVFFSTLSIPFRALAFSGWLNRSLYLSYSVPPPDRVRLARSRYRSPRRVRDSRDRAAFLSQSLAQSGFVATYRCTR